MNMIEKQVEFGKKMFEINQNTFKAMLSHQKENLEKYVELNQQFGQKLPEVKDIMFNNKGWHSEVNYPWKKIKNVWMILEYI